MNEYHKIPTLFKRDPKNMRYVFEGEWSEPELEWLKDNEWIFTEKVDGTNIRVMWDGKTVTFGGKTDNAQLPMPLITKLQALFDGAAKQQQFKEKFGEEGGVCLYGEGYGNRIQKVGSLYKKDDVDFVLFDVKVGNWWLRREDVEEIAVFFGVKVVPIVGRGPLTKAVELIKSGLRSQWGDFPAEGLVCRPAVELKNRGGSRIITKIKARDFEI